MKKESKIGINSKLIENSSSRYSILAQSSWWTLNKALTIFLGFDASLLLSDLSSKQDYFRINNKLDEDGFFFNLKKDIKFDTTLSEQRQDKAMDILTKHKLVDVIRKKSIPPKLFYRVNYKRINEILFELHAT